MYQAETDPYCYPNSSVLKNKAGLTNRAALEEYETAMTFARSLEPLPPGRFSVSHYRAVHHHLFQDVYGWAGRFRRIRIAKGASAFCYPENIAREMRRLFLWLKQQQGFRETSAADFTAKTAHFLAELNAIHPFREGNGRTQLTFLSMLADNAGHPLDLDRLDTDAVIDAMIQSFSGNEKPLRALIHALIG
jgi:cell filamentation protein